MLKVVYRNPWTVVEKVQNTHTNKPTPVRNGLHFEFLHRIFRRLQV